MPILKNQRHERFAQEVIKGQSLVQAYVAAGYKYHSGNAADLRAKQSVSARIEELQAEIAAKIAENLASTPITRDNVLKELAKLAFSQIGPQGVSTKDKRAALVNIAQIEGMIVERHEHGRAGDFSALTEPELAEQIKQQAEALGFADGEAMFEAMRTGQVLIGPEKP